MNLPSLRNVAVSLVAALCIAVAVPASEAEACGPYAPPTQEQAAANAAIDAIFRFDNDAEIRNSTSTVTGDDAVVYLDLILQKQKTQLLATLKRNESGRFQVISFRRA